MTWDKIREEQEKDPDISKMLNFKRDGPRPTWGLYPVKVKLSRRIGLNGTVSNLHNTNLGK